MSEQKFSIKIVDVVSVIGLSLCAYYLGQLFEIRSSLKELGEHVNITERGDPDIVIFNRVPKVGSQTIMNLIGELRAANGYDAFTSLDGMPDYGPGSETVFVPSDAQRKLTVEALIKNKDKYQQFVFLKHQNFLNFSEFGEAAPIYMNFVRHPVERVISWYYYVRAPWYQIEEVKDSNATTLKNKVSIREMKTTLEDCIFHEGSGCNFRGGISIHSGYLMAHASQMAFFCGHDKTCDRWESHALFKRAKENVEQYFSVIGVLEDWVMSLEVLEAYIPRYFAHSREIFRENPSIKHVNKNIYKPKVSQEVRQLLAAKMPLEIEFYNFVRQRLHRQHLVLQAL